GAPARAALRLLARGQAQGGAAGQRRHVDVGVGLVLLGVHGRDGVGDPLAFRAHLRIADVAQREDVVDAQRPRRGGPARSGEGRGGEQGGDEHGPSYVPRSARVSNAGILGRAGGGMRPVPLVVIACLAALPAPAGDPPRGAAYEDMAVDLLRAYLQVDTTNPPGSELRAARFYKEILDREGIPAEIDEFAPGRANLMATLK